MKKWKAILSLLISASLIATPTSAVFAEGDSGFAENFNMYETGAKPTTLNCASGSGNISVVDVSGEKALFLENENEGAYVSVSKSLTPLYSQYPVLAKVSFYQPYVKADGSSILQLYSGDLMLVSIETEGGRISAKTATGYTSLIDNYAYDTWYDIDVMVDLSASTATINIDGTPVGGGAIALLNNGSSVDFVRCFSKSSPGYYIDDLSVSHFIELTGVTVDGPVTQAIPSSGSTAVYTYTAKAVDNKGNNYTSGVSFSWELVPSAPTGVTMTVDGAVAKITLDSTAVPDASYTLKCTENSNNIVKDTVITPKTGVIATLEIIGDGVMIPSYKDELQYRVMGYDAFGNGGETQDVTFEFVDSAYDADFNLTTDGKLIMTNALTDFDYVEIKAKLKGTSVETTRKIHISNIKEYENDMIRRSIVKEYIDHILDNASDKYRGTPLLANGIDKDGRDVLWNYPNGVSAVTSDIGNQQALFRAMLAYSELTGDTAYRDRVYEIYDYTMKNHMQSYLIYWGPHASTDLKTGTKANTGGAGYHELELKDIYMDPFFELNDATAVKMVQQVWLQHITDWKSMQFNRHNDHGHWAEHSLSEWNNVDVFTGVMNTTIGQIPFTEEVFKGQAATKYGNPDTRFTESTLAYPEGIYAIFERAYGDEAFEEYNRFVRNRDGQSFFIAAADFLHWGVELYNKTKGTAYAAEGEKALLWSHRLANQYISAKDRDSGLLPITITSGFGTVGTEAIPDDIKYGSVMPYTYQTTPYGDRAYNQFADSLVANPNYPEATEQTRPQIIEAYLYETYPWIYNSGMMEVLELAEALGDKAGTGLASGDGLTLLEQWLTPMAKYLDMYYLKKDGGGVSHPDGTVPPIFACGINLDGYRTERCGYYGSLGRIYKSTKINSSNILSVVNAAIITEGLPSLTAQNATFWETARHMGRTLQIGDIGDPLRGVAPKLNFNCTSTDAVIIDTMIKLYEKTGEDDYLDFARMIGNNICENKFSDGMFVTSDTYSAWISQHEAVALMRLDAAINDVKIDALNYQYESNIYLQEYWIDDHGYNDETNQHSANFTLTYAPVKVKKVKIASGDITLKAGEMLNLDVTITPDDASDTSVYWEVDNRNVADIDFDNRLYALGKGETYIRAVAANSSVVSEPIKVIVE